jgi:chromosomal replication initiator protein
LDVKNAFAKQVLENEYLAFFEKKFSDVLGSQIKINFSLGGAPLPSEQNIEVPKIQISTGVNNNYVFDKFVVGAFNKLAYNAAQSLFKEQYWNPIFISGGVGLGKTHLLHAIGNKFVRSFPQKKIKYVTSDEFSRGVYSALSNGMIEPLKEEYESFDMLLVDDVQFLSNKEKINEIFFNIFNNNLTRNKIIVLASDRDPKELSHFNERMKSRFASGLLIQITKPDLESLKMILEHKIKDTDDNYQFTKDSLDYIVKRNSNDIRQLEGCLHQILFYASSFLPPNSVISLQTIKQIFSFSSNDDSKSMGYDFDPHLVIRSVCEVYRIPEEKVMSKLRTKEISLVRHVCMYVLKEKFPSMSLNQVGSYFGGRNHSTVIESVEKIEKMIKNDGSFGGFVKNLINKI